MQEEQPERELVVVPWQEIDAETLNAVVESFILREGTNYGAEEHLLTTKLGQVKKQLEQGSIVLVYDTLEDSITLLTEHELKRAQRVKPPS